MFSKACRHSERDRSKLTRIQSCRSYPRRRRQRSPARSQRMIRSNHNRNDNPSPLVRRIQSDPPHCGQQMDSAEVQSEYRHADRKPVRRTSECRGTRAWTAAVSHLHGGPITAAASLTPAGIVLEKPRGSARYPEQPHEPNHRIDFAGSHTQPDWMRLSIGPARDGSRSPRA
jgi:hypothetical protein